jgi:hypothetical protein
MGELLAFKPPKTALRRQREPASTGAEIIFFPGVRYERMTEPVQPAKRTARRPARRRTRPGKEKAS